MRIIACAVSQRRPYPEDAFDTPSLVLRAEEALDEAVKMGPGKVVLYGAFFGADDAALTM